MSIGEALAEGRRQAGLSITQVSQRTCIRETIIRSIERGDFSGCGGDFYARGHIRSIARVVGVNPEPLIDEYDATMGSPKAISAADVFQPVTPVKLKERKRPNWTAALALALILVAGIFAYQHYTKKAAPAQATNTSASKKTPSRHHATTAPAAHTVRHHLDITLTAAENSYVVLTTKAGKTIYAGMVYAGTSRSWREHRDVVLQIDNPNGVTLKVNGKNHPVTLGQVNYVPLSLHSTKA